MKSYSCKSHDAMECIVDHETSSPPSSMPKPSLRLLRVITGLLEVGGMRLLKSSLRRVEVPGVLLATGVRAHGPCAGLGVTLIKSEKQKLVPGVVGPNPRKPLPVVPGVICEDGSGVDLQGGVEGGWMMVLASAGPFAGEGEVARYIKRSAPSSPVLGVRDQETLLNFLIRRSGGGVVGGDEVIRVEALMLKLATGMSASSSSLNSGDGGSSAIVEPSEMKDRCEG